MNLYTIATTTCIAVGVAGLLKLACLSRPSKRQFAVIGVTADRRDYRARCAARELEQARMDAALERQYEDRVKRHPVYQRGSLKAWQL